MSPTRRQLIAGIFSAATVAALPDLTNAHDPIEVVSNPARDLFDRIEDATLFFVAKSPDTGELAALQLKVRGDRLTAWSAWRGGEPEIEVELTPNLVGLPDWIAVPMGELLLDVDAQS